MTNDTRRVRGGRQRAQHPYFLFGAKEASAGEEYRGIRQRLLYWCNETKTRRTARRRSSWSPTRRHHQSLSQEKTTFVRIACTSCPPSNLPTAVGSLPAQESPKCRITGSGRPLRFELWGAHGDRALYLSVSQRSNYCKNNTRDTGFILVRATIVV